MSANNAFDAVVEAALRHSEQHEAALETLAALTKELSSAVFEQTDEAITVALVTEQLMSTKSIARSLGLAPRRTGNDQEDERRLQFVVASNTGGDERVLWEVELADEGYPVIIRGPAEDESITCFTEMDLRDAFLEAAGRGIVGRKLKALHKTRLIEPPAEASDRDPR
ncbi:MAG: hypothetical protein AB1Z98_32260 [Nannocystaceae bacterium]